MTEPTIQDGQQRRVRWLQIVLAAIGGVILVNLAYWQLLPHTRELPAQTGSISSIMAMRGSILDANGQYLAVSSVEYEIDVTSGMWTGKQLISITAALAPIFGVTEDELKAEMTTADTPSGTSILGRNFSPDLVQALKQFDEQAQADGNYDLELDAFRFTPILKRVYADDGLAASVIGVANDQGGLMGLELYYQNELTGKEGTWTGVYDSLGRQILPNLGSYKAPEDGADLVLTIDRNVQHEAELLLAAAISSTKALTGTIMVMDAQTGGILAMANSPTFQQGDYAAEWERNSGAFVNTDVSTVYEPGMTIVPLTIDPCTRRRRRALRRSVSAGASGFRQSSFNPARGRGGRSGATGS